LSKVTVWIAARAGQAPEGPATNPGEQHQGDGENT
jgi:hypothetical protein